MSPLTKPTFAARQRQHTYNIWVFAATETVPLLGLILVLMLCILGLVGEGLGVFDVIWKESPEEPWWNKAMFWNGVGVGLFIATTSYQVYLLYANWLPDRREQLLFRQTALEDRRRKGESLNERLTTTLSRAQSELERLTPSGESILRQSSGLVFWMAAPLLLIANLPVLTGSEFAERLAFRFWFLAGSLLAVGFLAPAVLLLIYFGRGDDDDRDRRSLRNQADGVYAIVAFIYSGFVGFTLRDDSRGYSWWTTVLAAMVCGIILQITRKNAFAGRMIGAIGSGLFFLGMFLFVWNHYRSVGTGVGLNLSTIVLLLIVGAGTIAVASFLFVQRGSPQEQSRAAGVGYLAAGGACCAVGGLVGYLIRALLFESGSIVILPAAMSFCLFLSALGVGYAALKMYSGKFFYPTVIALVSGLLLIAAIRPYSHDLDHTAFGGEYAKSSNRDAAEPKVDLNTVKLDTVPAGAPQPLSEPDLLNQWSREARKNPLSQPPLVIVNVAGGASTSAIYTFEVLVQIEQRQPGFHRHVRMITGASGGMLGAAAYRVWLREVLAAEAANGGKPLDAARIELLAKPYREALRKDFLSPIVQAMTFKDAPMAAICPVGYADDRGRRLERAWHTYFPKAFQTTFDDLRTEEQTGQYPSLVFSPMMVEDGRPLFISTMDLKGISLIDVGDGYPARIRGVELMKLFPQTGWKLELSTAVRMSATFPFFSPAVVLPTIPPRRIVDAGYYDNYGLAVALAWVEMMAAGSDALRSATEQRTDRIILLQLRPYGFWSDDVTTQDERQQESVARVSPLVSPLQELTTPVEGLNNARMMSMSIRNADQEFLLERAVRDFDPEFRRNKPGGDLALMTVVFKGELKSSLNWYLSRKDIGDIESSAAQIFSKPTPTSTLRDRLNAEELESLLLPFKVRAAAAAPKTDGVKKQ